MRCLPSVHLFVCMLCVCLLAGKLRKLRADLDRFFLADIIRQCNKTIKFWVLAPTVNGFQGSNFVPTLPCM